MMERVIQPLYLTELQNLAIRFVNYTRPTACGVWINILDHVSKPISERQVKRILNGLCTQGVLEKYADHPFRYKLAISEFELAQRVVNGLWFGALATYEGELSLKKALEYHATNFD